jgi:hypothetical protein
MAALQKIFTLEITPERFVDCCSEVELHELRLLVEARLERIDGKRQDHMPVRDRTAVNLTDTSPMETPSLPVPAAESGQESKKRTLCPFDCCIAKYKAIQIS